MAYDLTGNQSYLDASRVWSGRMIGYQEKMTPKAAYYMNYGRKPGQQQGNWYVADSSSIAMGLLATAVRCTGPEKKRFLNSVQAFARLVRENYVGPQGGICNGHWSRFDGQWWCASGIYASLAFLLYDETGDKRYLNVAEGAVGWLNQLDPEKAQPYPLSEMGPTLPMYVLEAYSAGAAHLLANPTLRRPSLKTIGWYKSWMATQQARPPLERQWPPNVRWGMKFGGLPFHQYVYSRALPGCSDLVDLGDAEMQGLEALVFTKAPELTQLPVFMMMSYAERLSPGALYRSSKSKLAPSGQ